MIINKLELIRQYIINNECIIEMRFKMKNPVIAKMLKYYRKANNLSVDDIAAYLDECGISVANKTIYGWESGVSPTKGY